jgi:hypothetical protein
MPTSVTTQNKVCLLQEELEQSQAKNGKLLNVVQVAYRKHHLSDESIGWDELSDIMLDALCESMGDKGYKKWLQALQEKPK